MRTYIDNPLAALKIGLAEREQISFGRHLQRRDSLYSTGAVSTCSAPLNLSTVTLLEYGACTEHTR